MSIELTATAIAASEQVNIKPQLVLSIDGVPTIYGSDLITKILEIGDPEFDIGPALNIGDRISVGDQEQLMSMGSGTTTRISQQINQDRIIGDSISTMSINLIDKNNEITNLISPGNVITELLGTRCTVSLGFENTSYPDDFVIVFRGNLETIDSGAGSVTFKLNHPDDKKRSLLFKKAENTLNGAMTTGSTVITLDDASAFLTTVTGPSGGTDADFTTYVRIDDEIIKYTTSTATQLQTITRGQFGTANAAHDDGAQVSSFYRLYGNVIEMALKMMASGKEGPFEEDVAVESFVRISASETVANSIFFQNVDVEKKYNLQVGDYITTTGDANGANNVSLKAITGIAATSLGSYIVVSGVTFVESTTSAAVIDFRSQYDVWPDGAGLKMHNDEIDIDEHISVYSQFYSSAQMDFYVDDSITDCKEFIAKQLYIPIGAFGVPRKSRASVGVHFPPLPTSTVKVINSVNVKDPHTIKIKRSLNKNFNNATLYKFDRQALETDKFDKIVGTLDATSQTRFGDDVNEKSLVIESLGLRSSLGGESLASTATSRRLNKYKYGAEELTIKVNFKTGFSIEIGDIVNLDLSSLKISDIVSGTRDGAPRLFEVTNRSLDIKSGDVSLTIVDTNFDKSARYALISPSSFIKSGTSTTQFIIEQSFNSSYGTNEYKKWENFIGTGVVVRSTDFATSDTSTIQSISGNIITLSSALSFTPSAGYIMEMDVYDTQVNNSILVYGFMTDNATFTDGKVQYQMI